MALPPIRNANVPGRFAQGMQTGNALQQLREQRMDRMRQDQARNASGQLVGGNAQPNALAQLAQADPRAAMQYQQFQAQQQQATSEAEERESAMSAVRIHGLLSQGQVEPAMQMLAAVPDSPPKQQAMQALSQGDVQGALGAIEPVIEGYTRMGVLEAPSGSQADPPANVREYQYFQSLNPDQQREYLRVKRAQQALNLGGSYGVLDPVRGGMGEQFEKTPPPEQQPDFKGRQQFAKDRASKEVEDIAKREAQGRVSENLRTLSEYYDALDEMGAAINVERSTADNIVSSISASGPGQVVGRAMGTEAQSIRNRIGSMQPLLIQEIRKATEMGARGLDSNRELSFYLQAATDPTRDIQSNKAAIKVLDTAYGLGTGIDVAPEAVEQVESEWSEQAESGGGFRIIGVE